MMVILDLFCLDQVGSLFSIFDRQQRGQVSGLLLGHSASRYPRAGSSVSRLCCVWEPAECAHRRAGAGATGRPGEDLEPGQDRPGPGRGYRSLGGEM